MLDLPVARVSRLGDGKGASPCVAVAARVNARCARLLPHGRQPLHDAPVYPPGAACAGHNPTRKLQPRAEARARMTALALLCCLAVAPNTAAALDASGRNGREDPHAR